jgi:tetratricopeptide (TPR) repeat protein
MGESGSRTASVQSTSCDLGDTRSGGYRVDGVRWFCEAAGMDAAEWERQVAVAWAAMDDYGEPEFRALMKGLAAEAPAELGGAGDAEYGGAFDSTGDPQQAVTLYRSALERGLEPDRRRQVTIQLASSLRNLGQVDESVTLLTAELERVSDPLDDAVRGFLALALLDAGREREAVSCALTALAPHLTRYQRSMTAYAHGLIDPEGD